VIEIPGLWGFLRLRPVSFCLADESESGDEVLKKSIKVNKSNDMTRNNTWRGCRILLVLVPTGCYTVQVRNPLHDAARGRSTDDTWIRPYDSAIYQKSRYMSRGTISYKKIHNKSVARTYRDEGERANANTQWARKNQGPLLLRGVSPGEAAANAVSLHRVLPA
jgi:hypothetical protein